MVEQIQDEYLKLKRVSAHLLKLFKLSVREFISRYNEPDQEKKKYFELGKQIHMLILEPARFEQTYLMSSFDQSLTPGTEQQKLFCYGFLAYKVEEESKYAADVYAKIYKTERKSPKKIEEEAIALYNRFLPYISYLRELNTGKVVLPQNLTNTLNEAKTTILAHKKANELLSTPELEFADDAKIYNELEVLWDFKTNEGIVECKSKPDRVIVDTKNKIIKLIDLKTTSQMFNFKETITDFGYDIQLAFYWLALTSWFIKEFPNEKIEDYKQETYIVAYKTTGEPECKVYSIATSILNNALTEIELLMQDVSWHFKNDKWEYPRSYYEGDGVETIE